MATLNEERILDFLDGRLTSGQEEELLHTLAVSPERRGVLRAHMRLREITSNLASGERFTVPKHVTSQLFRNLEGLGLAATATTEEILTHAPQLAKVAAAEKAVTSAVLAAATATSGWHMSFASIVGASLLSFSLGAGAYHVFANDVGVHPLGELKPAVQMAAQQQASTSILHSSIATPGASESQSALQNTAVSAPEAPLSMRYMTPLPIDRNALRVEVPFDGGEPISFAAPLEQPIVPQEVDQPTQLASQRILASAIESPVENPKGTISLRYGMGVMPTNNITSVSSLEEMKFRWTVWDYIVGQASLGQLQTFVNQAMTPERTAVGSVDQIRIKPAATNNFVMGVEAGVTLDPIHLPMEATFGVMTDGTDKTYMRAGLFGHYEPFQAMSIVFGFEGIWYTHDINSSVQSVRTIYSSFLKPNAGVKGPTGSEMAGFFGPSIEFGWHF